MADRSRDQCSNELLEEGFATTARIVHEREEGEIERQLLLRDTPMWAKPGAQERPGSLQGVNVNLAEAVVVIVAGVFAMGVADRFVRIAPDAQTGVDVIFVGVDAASLGDGGRDNRLDRRLLHIGQHAHDQLAATLDQSEDRRLVLLQRAATRRSRQSPPSPEPPLFATAAGCPLCPATT